MSAYPAFMANGNIYPCRFVKLDTTADHKVLQSGAGDLSIGISQEGTNQAPIPEASTQYAAAAGQALKVYGVGERCKLEIGSGGCTAGDLLKPDADGKGVAVTAGNTYGAVALTTSAAGELAEVVVTPAALSHT